MSHLESKDRANRSSDVFKAEKRITDADLLRGLYGAQRKGELSKWIREQEEKCRVLSSKDRDFRVR